MRAILLLQHMVNGLPNTPSNLGKIGVECLVLCEYG